MRKRPREKFAGVAAGRVLALSESLARHGPCSLAPRLVTQYVMHDIAPELTDVSPRLIGNLGSKSVLENEVNHQVRRTNVH